MSVTPPQPFLLCVHDLQEREGRVWAVLVGRKWTLARRVMVNTQVVTVFKGPRSRQPKAYLRGVGRMVKLMDGNVRIDP